MNKAAGPFVKARNYCFLLLKFRPRSEWEIRQRLARKKYSTQVTAETVAFLKTKRFIDDEDFARAWTESRLRKPYGLRRIRQELQAKGIDQRVIEAVCAQASLEYPEEATVKKIAQEKSRALRGIAPEKAKQRIYGYLIRRGFSPALAIDALEHR